LKPSKQTLAGKGIYCGDYLRSGTFVVHPKRLGNSRGQLDSSTSLDLDGSASVAFLGLVRDHLPHAYLSSILISIKLTVTKISCSSPTFRRSFDRP
jgi:hypothetical protein